MHIFIVLSFGGYISTIPSHPHHAQVDSQGWILRGDPAAPRARRRGERQRKAMGAVAQHRSRKGHKDHKVKRTSLVGGLEHFFKYFVCLQMLGIIIPIDFHIFQRGGNRNHQPDQRNCDVSKITLQLDFDLAWLRLWCWVAMGQMRVPPQKFWTWRLGERGKE